MTLNIAYSDIRCKPPDRGLRLGALETARYTSAMKLRLKELRRARNLTQRELASKAGISTSYYTEIENGVKTINANRLAALAKALDVGPRDLITDESDEGGAQLLSWFQALSPSQQEIVLQLVHSMIERPSKG